MHRLPERGCASSLQEGASCKAGAGQAGVQVSEHMSCTYAGPCMCPYV